MPIVTTALSIFASVLSYVPGGPGFVVPPISQEPKFLDAPTTTHVLTVRTPDRFNLDQYESYDSRNEDSIIWDWSDFGGDAFAVSATRFIEQEFPVVQDFDHFFIPILRDSLITIDVYSYGDLSMYLSTNNDPTLKDRGFYYEIGSKTLQYGTNTFSMELEAGFYELGFSVAGLESQYDSLSLQYNFKITVQPRVYENSLDIRLLANRYNVKAAYWVNDAKPYGVADISQQTKLPLHSYPGHYWNGLPLAAYMANDYEPVLLSRLYVWDYETKVNLRNAILRIRSEALERLDAEEEYEIARNNVIKIIDGVELVAGVVLSFIPIGGTVATVAVSLGEAIAGELAYVLADAFMPPLVTNTSAFISYLSTLAAAFETTDQDAFETAMISVYYTATATEVDLSRTFTYHLEHPENLYYGDKIFDCPPASVGGGKIGYITDSFDDPLSLSGLVKQEVSESLSFDGEIHLNEELYLNSFEDYEYAGFVFKAPSSGAYSIQTSVDVGLKITVSSSWQYGLANSLDAPFERTSSDKANGQGEYVDFYLKKGESAKIFVEGEGGNATTGATNLHLSNDVSLHGEHHYRANCRPIDATTHGFYCWCGEYKAAPHNFGGAIPGTSAWQKAVCKVCGYANASLG